MEVRIEPVEGLKFAATARGHQIFSDQPLEQGGTDQGMTPPEMLLASLGTCAGHYAVQYLNARFLPIGGLAIRVSAEKAASPARLAAFRVEVELPHKMGDKHKEGLLRAVKQCLIHNTLLRAPELHVVINPVSQMQAMAEREPAVHSS